MLNITTEEMDNLEGKKTNYRYWIGKGLYVLVTPSGQRYWRFKYIYRRKERTLALGKYPEIDVQEVKGIHERLRGYLDRKVDPQNIFNKQKIKNKFCLPELLKIAFKVSNSFKPGRSRQSALNGVKVILGKLPIEKHDHRLTKRETELITYFVVNWME